MANYGGLHGNNSEVSSLPLNEEVIRVEQMVGCGIVLSDSNGISDSKMQIDNTHTVCKQNTHNIHNLPTASSVPLPSECTYLTNQCDYFNAVTTEGQNSKNVAELKDLQKTVFVDHELPVQNLGQDNPCNNSYVAICNGSVESSSQDTNLAKSVVPKNENSVLGAGRSNTYSTLSDRSGSSHVTSEAERPVILSGFQASSARDKEELVQARETANKPLHDLDTAGGNKTFKPGELSNKLIEGPCIMLPPSELPVIPSYTSLYNQRQTTSSATSVSHMPGLSSNLNISGYAEALTQNSNSSNSKAIQIGDNAAREGSENVSQQTSSSSDQEARKKATETAVSEPTSEQATPMADSAGKPKAKRTPNDFVFGKVIGEGSYSTVYLAKEVSTQREFAIKVCDKKHLLREGKTHFVMREKEVLIKLDHPFFIKLAYTFQDNERLYYVLTYARNGELLGYLHKLSAFDVPCTQFYSAEIVLALEYLHGLGIIHRDLKPENILISEDMHIKITDFGTSKILSLDSNAKNQVEVKRKNSFVGTAEYVSPEVLNNQPANIGSDLWALGCIIYQCLSGSLPFRSGNEYQTFQKIVKAEFDFPEGFHPDAKDLVRKLLVLDPASRLGMQQPEGMKALKNHSFYEGIDWERLPEATPPKLMPYLPANANNPEFWGQEQRTGFDDQRLAEIITGQSADGSMSPELEEVPIKVLSQVDNAERMEKLRKQRLENPFHQFVQDNLIIKQGFVDKRKGLFARKRMLLLTEGPHLYYVDAHNKVLKGEIPWSKYLRPEAKNFKIFFVHTPNRTYYLESRQPDAQDWVKQIREVWKKYFDSGKEK